MKYGRLVIPYSASDEEDNGQINSVDELNSFIENENDIDNLSGGAEDNDGNGTPNDDNPDEPEDDKAQQGTTKKQQPTPEQKQQYAFAQQQHQIKELTDLLKFQADAAGLKYSDNKDLVAQLKEKALVDRATQQNIPIDLLREVEQLRQDSAQWKRYQNEQNAMAGFNRIQADYGLDQAALEAFAVELDQAGRNPFNGGVDVVAEYKARHIDDIISAAVQKALKQSSTVDSTSSTPSSMQGTAGDGKPQTVSSVAQLNALLQGR